jgi:hypothetical protein
MLSVKLNLFKDHQSVLETKKQRSFKNFDRTRFEELFLQTSTVTDPADNVDDYIEQFNESMIKVLDEIAPVKTVTNRRGKKKSPWLSEAAEKAKRERRRHERKWKRTKSEADRIAYRAACRSANTLIMESRRNFFADMISGASNNLRTLWRTVNGILHPLVSAGVSSLSSNTLADFFIGKVSKTIQTIKTKLDLLGISRSPDTLYHGMPFDTMRPVSASEVRKLISSMPNKTSPLDLLPTNILKSCADFLSPFIATMANLSFDTGTFPNCFKIAQVKPILKKQGLDVGDPASYRPISNLHTLSKLLERLFLARLQPHLASTGRMDPYQSAYRSRCSTETALLKVASDLYDGMDNGRVSILVTLDISAAFDTIDTSILLERMETYFGVTGRALQWIFSYLEQRKQTVMVDGVGSPVVTLPAGVPQGSVLGPVLFSAFIAPLADVIDSFHILHHQYADDTNLYHSFSTLDQRGCLDHVSDCLNSVNNWFLTNGLLVNPGKSDSIFIGTSVRVKRMDGPGVVMGGTPIPLSETVKSLGVVLDQQLTFEKHVKNVCRICNFHIKSLRSLRPSLDFKTAETIGRSIVMSKMDYCNSLLAYTSKRNVYRLQMVQNNLARLVFRSDYRQSASPILTSLHWLPIEQRIKYKITTMVFKSRINLLPDYLSRNLKVFASIRPIRLSMQNTYVIPRVNTEVARHSFNYAGAKLWNELSNELRSTDSYIEFRNLLKTYYFKLCIL